MFLSRVPLDIRNRNTLKALRQPTVIHGAVESAFSGVRKRRLWRIDSLNGQLWLLIVSEDKPDLDKIHKQFGNENIPHETKDYDILLDKIQDGQQWRFRLTANPTASSAHKDDEARGKRYAHITTESQQKWLIDKAKKYGFEVAENTFIITESKKRVFYKNNSSNSFRITMYSVTYEGILKVTDAEIFRHALTNGIGREKAYGMGMLTVMRM